MPLDEKNKKKLNRMNKASQDVKLGDIISDLIDGGGGSGGDVTRQEFTELQTQVTDLEDGLSDVSNDIFGLNSDISTLNTKTDTTNSNLTTLSSKVDSLDYTKMANIVDSTATDVDEVNTKINAILAALRSSKLMNP